MLADDLENSIGGDPFADDIGFSIPEELIEDSKKMLMAVYFRMPALWNHEINLDLILLIGRSPCDSD